MATRRIMPTRETKKKKKKEALETGPSTSEVVGRIRMGYLAWDEKHFFEKISNTYLVM